MEPGWGKELFRGPMVPGNHVLTALFVYRGSKTGAYPWSGSFSYRVPGKVEFQAQRGLRLTVHLRVEVQEEQEDPRNRLAFRAALEPEMTAKVDDSPMPPPPPRKVTPEELLKQEAGRRKPQKKAPPPKQPAKLEPIALPPTQTKAQNAPNAPNKDEPPAQSTQAPRPSDDSQIAPQVKK